MGQLQQGLAASRVFVGGISGVNQKELRDHFEAYGTVLSVRFAYDYAGRRRDFGFIQFKHATSTQEASLVGLQHNIAGRLVTVQPVHQRVRSTHTRKAQHIVAGMYTLLDVLQEVPTLPGFLAPKSQKALSATCKSCRDRFIAQVQVVTIMRKGDYALVFKRSWPRLSMVILQYKGAYCSPTPTPNIDLFNIRIRTEDNSQSLISLLRPLHDPAIGVPCPRLAAQQLAHQMSIRWPSLRLLTMMEVHDIDGLYLEIVSQLVKGTWTHLAHLNLSGFDLKAEGLLILSQGNWPDLMFLDVSGSRLDAEGMALLAKGNWPALTTIILTFDPTMDAAAVSHLSAANWPIEMLIIADTPFSADLAAKLANLHFPELTEVDLTGCCGLTAATVSELARADWPSLCNLSFDHDDPDAMAVLLGLDLKKMLKSDARCCLYE